MTFRSRHSWLSLPLLAALLALSALSSSAAAAPQAVHFDGRAVEVPRGWPVYRLSQHPRMCVRLDRRAVYLGTPSPHQRCPAEAMGRRRAILVEPDRGAGASALRAAPRRATSSAGGSIFTGLGFDACAAPSSRSMAAWGSSPYRAVGVYIGGLNRACSQPNLTTSWVAAQTEAGWYLLPIYVGLQAPTSVCSDCGKLSASQATAQGAAEAEDAVEEAAAIGMGPGSPIYNDMEAYTQTSSATAATLAYLEAWTQKLHELGYLSGVYSSSASGIEDIARQIGTGYDLPDALWIANWNGQQNTADPAVPANAWANHQRIHQYRGGHNETWGGVTINIDNNYVDGPTVGSATLVSGDNPIGYLDLANSPTPGQVRVRGWAFDPNAPTAPLAIRLTVGGKSGDPGATTYELGAVATRSRRDVAQEFPEAGARHGFDHTLPIVKSGRQRVCAYALDLDPGEDRLLGCKMATVAVPLRLSLLKASGKKVRVRVTCLWPAGTECPGQIVLRSRFRVPAGRGVRTRPVSRVVGRDAFRLTGGSAQTFRVPLSGTGRKLLRQRGTLKTHVVVAIPGGRRIAVLGIRG